METRNYLILLVDDQPENINQLIECFKVSATPYDTLRASDGKMALKILEKVTPDLIITDWEMPIMDGITFIKKVKAIPALKDIPIIMCTGIMTTAENLQMALDAGAVDYLKKPIHAIELTARMSSMLKLSSLYKQVKKQNEEIKQQNEEINQQNEEITVQTELLTQMNVTKDKLFAIIGHDLRTPINSLKAILDLVAIQGITEHELWELSKGLQKQVSSIYFTLNNLLQWANAHLQGINPTPTPCNLQQLIAESINLLFSTARNKEITIVNQLDETSIVFADANQVDLICRNLLSNALKFTFAGGVVTIKGELLGKHYQLSIQDTGQGIQPAIQDRLFTSHHTTYGTHGEKGTGLGLSLCKDFIEKNGGTIWVESEVGKGSTFHITLPTL